MKHNQYNSAFSFYKEPEEFDKFTDKSFLQYCLGGTLYMPGTMQIVDKILSKGLPVLTSMVMCFEDSIQKSILPQAEQNVLLHLDTIADAIETGQIDYASIPLIFLRVRNTSQFKNFAEKLSKRQAKVLSGFVFPKFYSNNLRSYFVTLSELNKRLGVFLYAMPIL